MIPVARTDSNRRLYTETQIREFIGLRSAGINLKRLATVTALPVASPSGNGGAVAGAVPGAAGKVTPVRYECDQQDTSGQEESRAHFGELS